jgi:hypothetical protein
MPRAAKLVKIALYPLFTALAIAQQTPPAASADPGSLASIEGITLGPNGLPLPDTGVLLMDTHLNETAPQASIQKVLVHAATSDTYGRFAFQAIGPGTYVLRSRHLGYTMWLEGARTNPALFRLTVTAGQHLTGVAVHLALLPVLSGKVTDEDGLPMPGVTVRPMRPSFVLNGRLRTGNAGAGVQTGADGEYGVIVEPSRWDLSFIPPQSPSHPSVQDAPATGAASQPEQDYVTTYFPGVRQLSVASGMDAAVGQQLPGLNIRLQKTLAFHVRGKVAGGALPDLRIAKSQAAGDVLAGLIDAGEPLHADGTFDLGGLSPGVWTLILKQAGNVKILGRQKFQIEDRDVDGVILALHPPADLRGFVKIVPDPQPGLAPRIAPLEVRLASLDESPPDDSPETTAADDGAFTLKNIEAGKYRVDVTPPSGGFVKSVSLDGRECLDSGIDLSGGAGSSSMQIVVSMTAAQITGTVTNPDGSVPSTGIVTLTPDGPPAALYRPELHLTAPIDPSGRFVVGNVAPGRYRVYAWEKLPVLPPLNEDIPFADPEFPRLFDSTSAAIAISENESKQVSLSLISAAGMDAQSRTLR